MKVSIVLRIPDVPNEIANRMVAVIEQLGKGVAQCFAAAFGIPLVHIEWRVEPDNATPATITTPIPVKGPGGASS